MREYRIGDYAHYMGVTPDFLKHYEQFGLVTSKTRENGYRYYPFYQSSKLLECMKLRSYGVPLRDMEEILNEDSVEKVQEKLEKRVEAIRRQIKFGQAVMEEYAWFSGWLERTRDKTGDWHVEEWEEMYFLPHSNGRDFLDDSQIYEVLKDWVAWMPVVKSCKEIRSPDGKEYSWGLIVPAEFARKQGIPISGVVQSLPRCKMLFCDFRGGLLKKQEHKEPVPSERYMQETLDRLGLKATGSVYQVLLMYSQIDKAQFREYGFFAVPID